MWFWCLKNLLIGGNLSTTKTTKYFLLPSALVLKGYYYCNEAPRVEGEHARPCKRHPKAHSTQHTAQTCGQFSAPPAAPAIYVYQYLSSSVLITAVFIFSFSLSTSYLTLVVPSTEYCSCYKMFYVSFSPSVNGHSLAIASHLISKTSSLFHDRASQKGLSLGRALLEVLSALR